MLQSRTIKSSGALTSDAAVLAAPGMLHAVTLSPGTADSTLIIYDNASGASGTVLWRQEANADDTSVGDTQINIPCDNGIYADIDGASAVAVIHYSDNTQ